MKFRTIKSILFYSMLICLAWKLDVLNATPRMLDQAAQAAENLHQYQNSGEIYETVN